MGDYFVTVGVIKHGLSGINKRRCTFTQYVEVFMVAVDRPSSFISPTNTPAATVPAAFVQAPIATAATVQVAQLDTTDESATRLHRAADFDPVANISPEERPIPPSINEPIKGVLKGDELKERLSTLRDGAARRLINATYTRETLNDVLKNAGPGVSESLIQQVDAYNRADHTVQEMGELLKVLKDDAGVEALQTYLKESARGEDSGSGIDADGVYGPQSDEIARQRIQNPDATYVAPPTLRPGGEDVFVYQEGEVGEDGGTEMEAQANCGPASMAMIIERQGGEAPSMKELREDVNAPTGTRKGTYGLDTDQVTQGIEETLAAQGIQVETDVDIFSSKQSAQVIETMRERLAAGDDVILLTSNMGSGGATGHYVVVNEILDDGSFRVHDPQEPDGANTVQTADDLAAAMKRRAGTDRDTRVISIRRE
jgi:hypothetical protein